MQECVCPSNNSTWWFVQLGCFLSATPDGDIPQGSAVRRYEENAELLQDVSTGPSVASELVTEGHESKDPDISLDLTPSEHNLSSENLKSRHQTVADETSLQSRLEIALDDNDFDSAKRILQDIVEGSDESIRLPHGSNALHFAAASNHVDLAQYLIISGFEINAPTSVGRTPLHYAAFKGHLQMAKYLFSVGANPDCLDNNGRSPMMLAKRNGHKEMVQWFSTVSKHADVYDTEEAQETPDKAISCSCLPSLDEISEDTCEVMIQNITHSYTKQKTDIKHAGFLHNACIKGSHHWVKHWLENGVPVNAPDANGTISLHFACVAGKIDVVQLLMKHGADVHAQNDGGMTPLHIACDKEHGSIALYLIRQGASVDVKNNNGDTALHVMCSRGMEVLLREIVNLPRSVLPNMDLFAVSNSGINLLHCAADSGSVNTVLILIANEVDINGRDVGGKTPLHYACSKGFIDIVECLIQNNAEVDPVDDKGRTPFFLACSTGNLELAQYLVKRGAMTSVESERGNTALHVACRFGNLSFVQWLVAEGLDLMKLNKEQRTPAYYAKISEHTNISNWIVDHNNRLRSQSDMEFEDSDAIM